MSLLPHRVFVYGTLKRGFPNHFIIQNKSIGNAWFIGEAKLSDRYPLVIAGSYNIPFLLPVKGQGDEVYGELYEIDTAMLNQLDELEQHPIFYVRSLVSCVLLLPCKPEEKHERVIDCEAYFLPDFKDELLDLPTISRYTGQPPEQRSYIVRKDRDPTFDVMEEVKKNINN